AEALAESDPRDLEDRLAVERERDRLAHLGLARRLRVAGEVENDPARGGRLDGLERGDGAGHLKGERGRELGHRHLAGPEPRHDGRLVRDRLEHDALERRVRRPPVRRVALQDEPTTRIELLDAERARPDGPREQLPAVAGGALRDDAVVFATQVDEERGRGRMWDGADRVSVADGGLRDGDEVVGPRAQLRMAPAVVRSRHVPGVP